ncbi:ImmA/IrrE family metallo-endopeptidase [Enterococcus casseliflavus]|uniref:ImmA/IrrE family metallo-endopeptidase n=1 Tax=Enterococcus casseliflavus TaxID=37734 RepID=UPI003394AFCB
MQVYEELMLKFPELNYKFDPLMPIHQKGMIHGSIVYLNPQQNYEELNSTVAEEIGHYLTGSGNIIEQDTPEKRKQEQKARDTGATILVTPGDILHCFESGCVSVWECAEHLDITEKTFKAAIKYYARKYDGIKTENKYTILFNLNGTASVFKSFY